MENAARIFFVSFIAPSTSHLIDKDYSRIVRDREREREREREEERRKKKEKNLQEPIHNCRDSNPQSRDFETMAPGPCQSTW